MVGRPSPVVWVALVDFETKRLVLPLVATSFVRECRIILLLPFRRSGLLVVCNNIVVSMIHIRCYPFMMLWCVVFFVEIANLVYAHPEI
jgi:hypothetical protein